MRSRYENVNFRCFHDATASSLVTTTIPLRLYHILTALILRPHYTYQDLSRIITFSLRNNTVMPSKSTRTRGRGGRGARIVTNPDQADMSDRPIQPKLQPIAGP